MKRSSFTDQIVLLLEDGAAAEGFLASAEDQFARRTFIRSSLAVMEGIVWLVKVGCLQVVEFAGSQGLSVAERAMLSDETYELKDTGEVQTKPKYLRFADNVLFTFKICGRFFGPDLCVDTKSTEWKAFRCAVTIRNRIMHPKDLTSFDISDEEMTTCTKSVHWFNERVYRFQTRLHAWEDGELNLLIEAGKE